MLEHFGQSPVCNLWGHHVFFYIITRLWTNLSIVAHSRWWGGGNTDSRSALPTRKNRRSAQKDEIQPRRTQGEPFTNFIVFTKKKAVRAFWDNTHPYEPKQIPHFYINETLIYRNPQFLQDVSAIGTFLANEVHSHSPSMWDRSTHRQLHSIDNNVEHSGQLSMAEEEKQL